MKSEEFYSQLLILYFWIETFVKWMYLLFLSVGSNENGIVLNLPKPSLYKNISKGFTDVTITYILKSNLYPLINKGFFIYL